MKIIVGLVILSILTSHSLVIIRIVMGVVVLCRIIIYTANIDIWLGYLIIVVIIRGVLVLFGYVLRLSPNERFEVNNLVFVLLLLLRIGVVKMGNLNQLGGGISIGLWGDYLGGLILYLVVFLLWMMVLVTWIGDIDSGSLKIN